ncbi:MAG: tRNA (adenosine(37)-N6)-threonylcarbamoyltransferase complex dimerization subunit type 1 TsaB [Elusimicrobiota bacterium]
MKILAIETSGNTCGAALVCDTEIITEQNIFLPKKSSSKIFEIINGITKKHRFDAVAVDTGPGSFTGIRIGISLARVFGQFLKIPVVGISSLDCLVYSAIQGINFTSRIFPIVDAFREEVYTAQYTGLKRETEYKIVKISNLEKLAGKKSVLAGEPEILKKIATETNFMETNFICVQQLASTVGFLAYKKFKKKENITGGYETVLPLYIRHAYVDEQKKINR